jgi:geranylgeranyl pyrophosphate synthase
MDYQDLRRTILGVPQLADWPEIAERFKPDEGLPSQDWRLPVAACQAVGGAEAACLAAGGAVTCLQMSILIIDDLLDEDPRGAHHEIGVGAAANIAAALESAAVEVICRSGVDASIVAAAAHVLSETALQTALGQRMDVLNRGGEADYWAVIRAKSSPFYRACFELGAIMGQAEASIVAAMAEVGVLVGESVQLHDDLLDALEVPAQPDWKRPENNLLTLYALTTEYPEKDRFLHLLERVDDDESLREAQRILVRSGAVSYCAYELLRRHKSCADQVEAMGLANPAPMKEFLKSHFQPLLVLFAKSGATGIESFLQGIA